MFICDIKHLNREIISVHLNKLEYHQKVELWI